MSTENEITPETNIYRYMSLVRFIQLLEEGFFISTANNFEDAYDCKIPKFDTIRDSDVSQRKVDFDNKLAGLTLFKDIKALIEKSIASFRKRFGGATRNSELTVEKIEAFANKLSACDSDKQEVSTELFCILEQETYKSKLISCWCLNPEESYLMWKTYAAQGVRIGTTIGKFQGAVEKHAKWAQEQLDKNTGKVFENGEVYNGFVEIVSKKKVVYCPLPNFNDKDHENNSPDDFLFKKLSAYEGEQEYRFVIGSKRTDLCYRLQARYPTGCVIKGIFPLCIIDEICLSPLLNNNERESITRFLERYAPCIKHKLKDSILPINL